MASDRQWDTHSTDRKHMRCCDRCLDNLVRINTELARCWVNICHIAEMYGTGKEVMCSAEENSNILEDLEKEEYLFARKCSNGFVVTLRGYSNNNPYCVHSHNPDYEN